MSDRMFYVAMSKDNPGKARASCVDEQKEKWGKSLVKEFYRDYYGHEIRHVNGDEMMRLMHPDPGDQSSPKTVQEKP